MKHCPECDSSFPDTDQFCELDGTTLVADYSDSNPDVLVPPADRGPQMGSAAGVVRAGGYQVSRDRPLQQNWTLLIVMAVAGVAIGMVLFVVYQRMTGEIPEQSPNEPPSNEAVTQQQIPLRPLLASPSVSATPSPEPSPSPSVMPSPVVQTESAPVALSSSPVSTGGDEKTRRGTVTIRLTNGTSVEADEVWETGEGIWYRHRGVVTLLERQQVNAIEKPSPGTSSPAATPTASPSGSP
jgi:cytoskeletal protein RodZ